VGHARGDGGFAAIGDYAVIGDGRALALVARDGSIDWLVYDGLDEPSVACALLDPDRGGSFELRPVGEFRAQRRYVDDTNVLETTFHTSTGSVRVTDCITRSSYGHLPWFELARRIEPLSGTVTMQWRLAPRFRFGQEQAHVERRGDAITFQSGDALLGLITAGAGETQCNERDAWAETTIENDAALLTLVGVKGGALPIPTVAHVEERITATIDGWRRWLTNASYEGEWSDAVTRSALALKLLVDPSTGAIVAAPTTSLPERIGGDRNWDYRYAWLRDCSFTLDAFMRLSLHEEAHASVVWLLRAAARTSPWMQVLYGLDGRVPDEEHELPDLDGYRHSKPVRSGNAAGSQLQLGTYGHVLETIWIHVRDGNLLDPCSGAMVARTADYVCEIWHRPDAGIWEVRGDPRQFTSSKIGCWIALDRAIALAEHRQVPDDHVERWRRARDDIRAFVDRECWSDERGSYTMHPDTDELAASCLLASRAGFLAGDDERMTKTIDAVRVRLADGPFLYRYGDMREKEGAFLACSFWLVEALARAHRFDEAGTLMDELLEASNDVGLFSEEIDPGTRELLGNFPQGLTHLALVNAASVFNECKRES
jgi:GH15 family glucan-1,4-alpha-glucosidase